MFPNQQLELDAKLKELGTYCQSLCDEVRQLRTEREEWVKEREELDHQIGVLTVKLTKLSKRRSSETAGAASAHPLPASSAEPAGGPAGSTEAAP